MTITAAAATHTEAVGQLLAYAVQAGLDADQFVTALRGLDRRVDAGVVPGAPSGYLCERCDVMPDTCHVRPHTSDTVDQGAEDLCYACTVMVVHEALHAGPAGSIDVEVRRALRRH